MRPRECVPCLPAQTLAWFSWFTFFPLASDWMGNDVYRGREECACLPSPDACVAAKCRFNNGLAMSGVGLMAQACTCPRLPAAAACATTRSFKWVHGPTCRARSWAVRLGRHRPFDQVVGTHCRTHGLAWATLLHPPAQEGGRPRPGPARALLLLAAACVQACTASHLLLCCSCCR